jgi:site-specific recombinase XerD
MSQEFRLQHSAPAQGHCPYRLLNPAGQEIPWARQFLDAQCLRGLSPRSLRIYAYDLLNFVRWWFQSPKRSLARLNQSSLLDYVRYQLSSPPQPAPRTVNHRLTVLHCLYRFLFGRPISGRPPHSHTPYRTRSSFGYGKTRAAIAGLRLKQPRCVVVPLNAHQVAQFWHSFRTFRDLSLVAFMLGNGLRSAEALSLQLQDADLSLGQVRVCGKGGKQRILPLPEDTLRTLQNYLLLERPFTSSPFLFVSLKGTKRGQPMTSAGLRSLFRHHRRRSRVPLANPHRLRHTFGSDMVSAGISLPALMHLMGHSHIETTMLYVQLSPQEVWRQFHLAICKRNPSDAHLP